MSSLDKRNHNNDDDNDQAEYYFFFKGYEKNKGKVAFHVEQST